MLPKSGKLLALDLGTRHTGVALSDHEQKVAFAREVLSHKTEDALLTLIKKLLEEEKVVGILIGRPIKLSGESTIQTKKVEETAKRLGALKVPIEFIDERLSSEFAENLHGFKTEEKYHDSRAAQILLETYLAGNF